MPVAWCVCVERSNGSKCPQSVGRDIFWRWLLPTPVQFKAGLWHALWKQPAKAGLPLGSAGAGADSTPASDTGMEPVGMIWQHRVCRGNKLRQVIRKTRMAWNGLDVQGNDPSPIFPSTCSLEQLPHWDPKESCIFTPSAFFCVLGQWKWMTALAGISPKVGTQPFWSTDGVRSGFSLQTGEAMWFSYNLERFITEWRLIRCLEFPRNNVDSVSSLHTTRTHS